jgi:hypothetical protein
MTFFSSFEKDTSCKSVTQSLRQVYLMDISMGKYYKLDWVKD